jgi:hypothetical protein
MQDNAKDYAERCGGGRGAPGKGAALLQGLAVCGECGRKMRIAYKSHLRYLCDGVARNFAEPMCAHLDGPSVETFVVKAFFEAIQPAQLNALDEVLAQRQRERSRLEQYHRQQIQQAQYEVTLARRRYEQVDPDNRLVASELERQWEETLRKLQETQEAAERFTSHPCESGVSPEWRQQLLNLSEHLPHLWSSGQLTHEQCKQLLRSLITRVILKRTSPDQVQVKIVWVSGHFSEGIVIPPVHKQAQVTGYQTMVLRVEQLWREGQTDVQIAQTLSMEGFHSARSTRLLPATVLKIRNQHHWVSRFYEHRHADKIDGMWTIRGLSTELGVRHDWFYNRIRSGFLREPDVMRKPPYGNYLIRDDVQLIERLRSELKNSRRILAKSQT